VTRAIRKYLRDFLAIIFMIVVAAGVAGYILSNQRFYLPAWVPVVGTDFYTVKAELQTAQAVVPGQGQSVNIAGVKVGDIGSVKLEDGRAVVDMNIRRKYAPIYKDASILLRPKTGLKDMYLELDPGNRPAGELSEGHRIPVAATIPDVNPDEILASLDGDTRDYLRVLLNAGAEGLEGDAPTELRQTLKRFEPLARDQRKATRLLIQRRRNIRRTITNFQELATELGSKDRDLAALIDSANANFEAIAAQDANLREALRLFPGALEETRTTLADLGSLAGDLGPALSKLRPGARALAPSLRASRPFLRTTTPVIRDQLRPFARDVRPTVRDTRRAAKDLAVVTPRLSESFKVLNSLFNALAYNPRGSEEGYLFWASWLNHAGAGLFAQQDAHGPVRRGQVLISCGALNTLETVIRPAEPQLDILTRLLNPPTEAQVCK
jgi:phospholipid/cholesterol/gamma-HCH transport system substrate-binding protein